jgi:TPR repeat protein
VLEPGVTTPVGRDDEARQWYERAAELGDTVAMNNLGELLARADAYEEAAPNSHLN